MMSEQNRDSYEYRSRKASHSVEKYVVTEQKLKQNTNYNYSHLDNVLSRAINFGRQCHFKIWLDCHKFKKFPCLIISTSTKCQKI
jgi:hypothetical protein